MGIEIDVTSPNNTRKLFTVKLEPETFASIEAMAYARHFGRTVNDVARIIIEQWACDGEKDFFESYRLSMKNAIRQGYYPIRERKMIFPMPITDTVFVGLRGLPRYLVEKLPLAEPTCHVPNPRYMPNEFYQRTPEKVIADVLDYLAPQFAKEANESLFGEDDDEELSY